MQITTQRFPTRTLVAAASGLTLALSAAVAHAGSIDPYQPAHKVSRADPYTCLLYTSPSPRDRQKSRMPSSA